MIFYRFLKRLKSPNRFFTIFFIISSYHSFPILCIEETGLQNARVFVGNLPWSVDNDELSDHMAQGGEVISAVVIRDSSG